MAKAAILAAGVKAAIEGYNYMNPEEGKKASSV